jgi:hypothetical protein
MSMTKKEYVEYRAKKQLAMLERRRLGIICSTYIDSKDKVNTIQNHRIVTMRSKSIPVTLAKIGEKK